MLIFSRIFFFRIVDTTNLFHKNNYRFELESIIEIVEVKKDENEEMTQRFFSDVLLWKCKCRGFQHLNFDLFFFLYFTLYHD